MKTFRGDVFQVQIEAPFKCDNPLFDSFESALDCYNKAVEMMYRWKHHDVKVSLVQLVHDCEIVIYDTIIV